MGYPWYNTTSPTPLTNNTINSVSPNIRDYLLNKNLLPQYPYIGTSINGAPRLGQPFTDTSVNSNSNQVPLGLPLETEGILRYNISILPNQFKDTSPQAGTLLNIDTNNATESILWPNVDFPNGIESYPTAANNDINSYGLLAKTEKANFANNMTLLNLYVDANSQIDMSYFIDNIPPNIVNQVSGGYLDEFGGLNGGSSGLDSGINASSILGNAIGGAALGLAQAGVLNYDLGTAIATLSINGSSSVSDTPLGSIGAQQLALSLAQNVAFNVLTSALDATVNTVTNSILTSIGVRPDFTITIPSNNQTALTYTESILGFSVPVSYLSAAGSIFLSESNNGNIERANAMLANTGIGQQLTLIANVNANINGTGPFDNPKSSPFRSGYVAGYVNTNGSPAINPNLYAYYNGNGTILAFELSPNPNSGVIPTISYNRSQMIETYGFTDTRGQGVGPQQYNQNNFASSSDVGFTWTSTNPNAVNNPSNIPSGSQYAGVKKNILSKTQELFNSTGMKTIISRPGDMSVNQPDQIQTSINGGGISRGSAVLNGSLFNNGVLAQNGTSPENTFCRSWTTLNRYNSIDKLIRNGTGANGYIGNGLWTSPIVPYRYQTQGTILDSNGIPQIAPYVTDSPSDPKKYMFSIENLAWSDSLTNLLPSEIGPGDLLSGKQGRIMWFPPYDISFTENTTVNWESTNFIGRGEPIYTYNNTERSGTISFTMIVDHPTYINSFKDPKGPDDNYVASFFAGCIDPTEDFADKLTILEVQQINATQITNLPKKTAPTGAPPETISVYFPNDVYDVSLLESYGSNATAYENGLPTCCITNTCPPNTSCGIGTYQGQLTNSSSKSGVGSYTDSTNFGLNTSAINLAGTKYNGWSDPTLLNGLNNYLNQYCPNCVITTQGYASGQGVDTANTTLAQSRAQSVMSVLKDSFNNITFGTSTGNGVAPSNCNASSLSTDSLSCKTARKVDIIFTDTPANSPNVVADPVAQTPQQQYQQVNSTILNRYYKEDNFFEQFQAHDPFIFDKFRQKIRYFQPAFHSTTPEGFNGRLTFLQQCTRQGPTLSNQGPNNLAFGRPPVCILRIGDFFNTKIIIENIGIDYEPLVWDLNPEGIGVQPMIAKVNMSVKIIGGSTLLGPINKLQNALSFNYYANTQVYDYRADYIALDPNAVAINQTITSIEGDTSDNIPSFQVINGTTNLGGLYNAEELQAQQQVANQTPPIAQGSAASINGTSPQQMNGNGPTTPTTNPQILGFTTINAFGGTHPTIAPPNYLGSTTWQFKILLNTQNIETMSASDMVSYETGIKIKVGLIPTSTGNYFEYVYKNSDLQNNFNGGIVLTPNIPLLDGTYSVNVSYNGTSISTTQISLTSTIN